MIDCAEGVAKLIDVGGSCYGKEIPAVPAAVWPAGLTAFQRKCGQAEKEPDLLGCRIDSPSTMHRLSPVRALLADDLFLPPSPSTKSCEEKLDT